MNTTEKTALIEAHEAGVPASELAHKYDLTVASVAAYVANAHRYQIEQRRRRVVSRASTTRKSGRARKRS